MFAHHAVNLTANFTDKKYNVGVREADVDSTVHRSGVTVKFIAILTSAVSVFGRPVQLLP